MEISNDNKKNVQNNTVYKKLNIETQKILSFLSDSILAFPQIFNQNYSSLDEVQNFLKTISLPNKYVCAKYIDQFPGWTCKECARYTDSVFCFECYKKSKELHKGHHIYLLPSSGGMCGCGEPEALNTFCPEHCGPHMTQKDIDEYISKVFSEELLEKLNNYFGKIFEELSNYFILGEKCELFCNELFTKYFENIIENDFVEINIEKQFIISLKNNFKKVFEKFLDFLNTITQDNLGMLYLISNYFMRNYFNNNSKDTLYKTKHRCVKFDINDLNIIKTDNNEYHICQCPFFTLLILNWRDNIDINQNLFLSFTKIFPLKHAFGIIYFTYFDKILLNKNIVFLENRIQFILDYSTKILSERTNIIEATFDIFYKYCKEKMEEKELNDSIYNKMYFYSKIIDYDATLYSMPITKNSFTNSKYLIKRIIDCLCLIQNKNKLISIYPHPIFQNKGFSEILINLELKLLSIIESINMFTKWNDIKSTKEIFNYLINKILNQKKEGIDQLNQNEFSFHLGLYRCFGLLLNFFCFDHALNNKSSLLNSIEYFKSKIIDEENKKQLDETIKIILDDYFKLFAFVSGIKNGFFNYYESMQNYSTIYFFDNQLISLDITLFKYLISLSSKNFKFNLKDLLFKANIEKSFLIFEKLFLIGNENPLMIKNNLTADELLDLLNNTNDIFPNSINYGENLQIIQSLYDQLNTKINSNIIQHYINGTLNEITKDEIDKINLDEFNSIMHLKFILDILIIFLKDDSAIYFSLMKNYKRTSSALTKKDLFENIKSNKHCMKDLNNIIKEKLVCEFISNGNLNNIDKILTNIDKYLLIIFDENEINEILDQLTTSKKLGNKQLFYLKDSSFNFFDTSFYYSYKDCSNAQRYIYDFKKDSVKSFNTYLFQNSELIFDLNENVFEKIFLNEKNLVIVYKIINKIFLNKKEINKDLSSIKYIMLPTALKYLSIFGCINTKNFIKFKLEYEEIINKIIKILSESNNNKQISNLENNINEVINQLNSYKIINEKINNDFSKLNKHDFNFFNFNLIKEKNDEKHLNKLNKDNIDNNNKNKNIKEKLKNRMKFKNIKFLENTKNNNKEIYNEINIEINTEENFDDENETMCFICRKKIKLNSFLEPYGQGGYILSDYFFSNCLNASINSELNFIKKEININHELAQRNKSIKFISCGHYFHFSCFNLENNNDSISCPLCLKKLNILIPPLNHFYNAYDFLKPYSIENIYEKNLPDENINIFLDIINDYLSNILTYSENDDDILKKFMTIFKTSFNYVENLFYYKVTNFHKLQQIKINQNFILIIRCLLKVDIINSKNIFNHVIKNLSNLIKGPSIEENALENYENMYYINIFETILFYLAILFDYDIIKELVLYIIYIFVPYICFGLYLKDFIIDNNSNSNSNLNIDKKILGNVNLDNIMEYIEQNNEKVINVIKFFLQKFTLMKLITDHNQKQDDNIIINKMNNLYELNITEYFEFLDIKNINNINNKDNNITIKTLIEILSKELNISNIFSGKLENKYNFNEIINSLIKNIQKMEFENNTHLIKKEFLIQFSLIKFSFINLEENFLDFVENYLEKKCILCNKASRYFYICLICGNKICHTTKCNKYFLHKKNCGGKNCIFINADNGEINIVDEDTNTYSSIYMNKQGVIPNNKRIDNGYILNKEKEEQYFKKYICYDFHFN